MLKVTLIILSLIILAACQRESLTLSLKEVSEEVEKSSGTRSGKYEGKEITVRGYVDQAATKPGVDLSDRGIIRLKEKDDEGVRVLCYFAKKDTDEFSKIKARQFITVKGIFSSGNGLDGCTLVNAEPIAKTKITKDSLKAGLREMKLNEKKITFLEKSAERVDISIPRLPKLKIVSSESPPKVELNKEVLEFSQLPAKLDFKGKIGQRVTLAASESDIAFYNKEGISVEDFVWVIGNLNDVEEFIVDFGEIEFPDMTSPQLKTSVVPIIKPGGPALDETPLPFKKESKPK